MATMHHFTQYHMKNKDEAAKRSIRAIKAAILLQKTDGSGKELDEAGEIKLLQKLVKQRRDSLEIYVKQGREDLAAPERERSRRHEQHHPHQGLLHVQKPSCHLLRALLDQLVRVHQE